jgi:hypothetical protein
MKLLIPTNDGINISPDFDWATSFRFIKVVNGSIKEDQLMVGSDKTEKGLNLIQNLMFENSSNETNNTDPELGRIIITRAISIESETNLLNHNYKVFHSGETNIINAINKYLKDYATHESDYCCCP